MLSSDVDKYEEGHQLGLWVRVDTTGMLNEGLPLR